MTTDYDQELENIEISKDQAKNIIERGDALVRLSKNKDFQLLFDKGIFELEPIRLVHLKAHPAMQGEQDQAAIIKEMDAVGWLQNRLIQIEQKADMARAQLEAYEKEEELLLAEQDAELNGVTPLDMN